LVSKPLPSLVLVDEFAEMRAQLLTLLNSLTPEEWETPTVCEGWTVKDVALHMLGDDIGVLSRLRDGYSLSVNINGWGDLVTFINNINDLWVRAARRMSVPVLRHLFSITTDEMNTFLASLDSEAMGEGVNWISDDPAPRWLEIGRQYTEYWLHQQHIRDAVNKPGLKERRFFAPVINMFVRALPKAYHNVIAPNDTLIKLVITGEGGEWHLVREHDHWTLYAETDLTPVSTITMDDDTAWRLFTRGMDATAARQFMVFEGDISLCEPIFNTISIIA
jgi:uncharacterized protein (TIGR03083 family)